MLGLVTAEAAAALDPDLLPLDAAIRSRLGDERVEIVAWDDPGVDWSGFDAVVIRSTWDYADRLAEFHEWIRRVESETTLINNADAVRWSSDKRYLADLAEEGIEIVPTTFVAPGETAPEVTGLHVVKPTVGAGSNGARRCEAARGFAAHIALLHSRGAHGDGAALPRTVSTNSTRRLTASSRPQGERVVGNSATPRRATGEPTTEKRQREKRPREKQMTGARVV